MELYSRQRTSIIAPSSSSFLITITQTSLNRVEEVARESVKFDSDIWSIKYKDEMEDRNGNKDLCFLGKQDVCSQNIFQI